MHSAVRLFGVGRAGAAAAAAEGLGRTGDCRRRRQVGTSQRRGQCCCSKLVLGVTRPRDEA